jgi:magnesium transporter
MENRNEMKKVYWLRKELLYLKNSLEPVHISLKNIIQYETPLISAQTIPYIRDVEDNVTQIMEEISTFREMVNSLYETQMSNSGNDMNRIMMTLTIFSAIFIPLSFLAGIFGMNFASVPGLSNPSSFIIFCAGCVTIAALMLIFFKLRKWF